MYKPIDVYTYCTYKYNKYRGCQKHVYTLQVNKKNVVITKLNSHEQKMMSTNHLRLLQLQQLLKIPTMAIGTLLSTLNYSSSNVCEIVLSHCSTRRFNFFPKCCQCSWFSTVYNILNSPPYENVQQS